MEIKGIGGVINTYKPQKISTARKAAASVGAKKTDRVEFGFETALTAAKNEIAREAAADASPAELLEAQNTARQGVEASVLASCILMG